MDISFLKTIKKVFSKYEDISFVYVFGSFARFLKSEEKIRFNDIDLAIYVSGFKHLLEGNKDSVQKKYSHSSSPLRMEMKLEKIIEDLAGIPVDVRILNYAPIAFQYNVIKEGAIVLDNDKDLRADFENLVFKKYFDYIHLRNEYLGNVRNATV